MIHYEDDLVIVKDAKTGDIHYKGMEDYCPYKRDNWVWNEKKKLYELNETVDGKEWKLTKEKIG